MSNDAPAKFSFIKYANYSVQTCNVMVAPQWKSNISGDVTIVWIVSLLYNKEKASYAFFGKNVNKLVHFFVYGFRLTFAVFNWTRDINKIRLIRSLIKFIFRYQDLVEIYSVFAEKIISDGFSYGRGVLWGLFNFQLWRIYQWKKFCKSRIIDR
jgi:hypothetical protein